MSLFRWSRVKDNNNVADLTCPFPEGQSPSSINDGDRGQMAAVAKFRDDISGAIVTGGTSTAYTVTSYQVFDSLAHLDGNMIAFTPHATNGATVTINVDGLGYVPLRSSPGVELPSAALIQGTPYVATYSNTDGVFYLQGGLANPYNIPLGGFVAYGGAAAPNSSFVLPFGQALNRTTYAALYSLFANTYGAGDGSTTFNIPDLRGRGIFFKDNMGGSAANRITSAGSGIDAVNLSAIGGGENITLVTGEIPSHSHANTLTDLGHTHGTTGGRWGSNSSTATSAGGSGTPLVGGANTFITIDGAVTGVSITNVAAGGGGAHNNMPPAYILNCIMRVI